MRVLVATHQSNGAAEGDYNYCVEGELVYMQEPCASDLRNPEGPCGCGRGFAGLNSHHATTTALVVETPVTECDVREALRSSLEAGGWINEHIPDGLAERMVEDALEDVQRVATHFALGSVVRRRLSKYFTL